MNGYRTVRAFCGFLAVFAITPGADAEIVYDESILGDLESTQVIDPVTGLPVPVGPILEFQPGANEVLGSQRFIIRNDGSREFDFDLFRFTVPPGAELRGATVLVEATEVLGTVSNAGLGPCRLMNAQLFGTENTLATQGTSFPSFTPCAGFASGPVPMWASNLPVGPGTYGFNAGIFMIGSGGAIWRYQLSFDLGLIDPVAQLTALRSASIGAGPGTSLADKIALAMTYYEAGDIQTTCAVLGDFLNQVRAQRGKKLTPAQADELRRQAEAIINGIGCS